MKKSTKTAALLLCALALASAAATSCGNEAENTPGGENAVPQNAESAAAGTEAQTDTEDVYPFETKDLGGFTLRVLNSGPLWNQIMTVDTETMDGEVLNDAIYNRNRTVEQLLNCGISVTEVPASDSTLNPLKNYVQESVLSGEDLYDVMFAPVVVGASLVTDGYFMDLLHVDGLHVDSEWWDSTCNRNMTIDNALYFAEGALHLRYLDAMFVLYFNEDMLSRYDLEKPYDLVRNGQWTVDRMLDYQKAVANLNGDDSFKWSQNGSSVYGLSLFVYSPRYFINGCNEFFIDRDADDLPVFAAGDERFYRTLESIARVLDNTSGYSIYSSDDDFNAEKGGYQYIFSASRALFLTAQIKAAQQLRDMKDTFGIIPYPKLDEAQERYSSYVDAGISYTIPVTNTHLAETAMISDVLTWQSWKDVLPVYFGSVVEQKGLRNEDSIEMLNLIRQSSQVELGQIFGWIKDIEAPLREQLYKGNGALASTVEKNRSKIESNIETTLNAFRSAKENN